MKSSSLDAIGLKYGTDKASIHHDYLGFYEDFISSLRHLPISLLEIGVSGGASLKMWEEYFPLSKVVGVDIDANAKRFEQGRVSIELVDQSNVEELTRIAVARGPFDIVVEDGSHMWEHQTTTLRTLFPFVKDRGIYIVEDLQTNYGSMERDYRGVATSTCVEYLKRWLDLRVGDDQIAIEKVEDAFLRTYGRAAQFLAFHKRACLIKKQYRPVAHEPVEGQPVVEARSDALPVKVVAHLSYRGDIVGMSGFVNPTAWSAIQGLLLSDELGGLEYRVKSSDDRWSDWSQNGEFAGTRGRSELLTGITVRLRADVREHWNLQTFLRFIGSEDVLTASDGEDAVSPSKAALCGVQVVLTKKV